MKIAVMGTGMVGHTIASKLIELGHEVAMGSRTADSEKGTAWLKAVGSELASKRERASLQTFFNAAKGAEVIFNCTAGVGSLLALEAAGASNLAGKVLVDVSNPLDFSQGFPPSLSVCNTGSLGEQIQTAFPEAQVVKTLNTVSHTVMVRPDKVPGEHVVFVAGNHDAAKGFVRETILGEWFGWKTIVDLGDISAARGTEMYLPLWVRMWKALGTSEFNIALVKEP